MSLEYRIDVGGLRRPEFLADGRARVDGHITTSGVFEYVNPDGSTRREYRPPAEVFNPASLESFKLVPVTNLHPPDGQLLTARTAKRHTVGTTGEAVRRDGEFVAAPLMINDAEAVQSLRAGRAQLSCGYAVDYDPTPGVTPDGQRYDGVQRNIRGNHVALVDYARAGEMARVRMDAGIMRPADDAHRADVRHGICMPGDLGYTPMQGTYQTMADDKNALLEAAAAQLAAANQRAATAESSLTQVTARADAAEGAVESMRTEIAALKATRLDEGEMKTLRETVTVLGSQLAAATARADAAEAPERLRKAVQGRVRDEAAAFAVLGKDARLDDMSDRLLMVSVVEKLHGTKITDDMSDAYLRGRFDTAVEGFRQCGAQIQRIRETASIVAEQPRVDSSSAHDQMKQRNRDAWKTAPQKGN